MPSCQRLIKILLLCLIITFVGTTAAEYCSAFGGDATAVASGEDAGADHGSESKDRRTKEFHDPGIVGNLVTLAMLVLLQAVLGFDNLLYISLESKHAPEDKRQSVRAWGIGLAIGLRIVLLFALLSSKKFFEETSVFAYTSEYFSANINLHSLIVFFGGAFIMYTGVKEIWHMTRLEHDTHVAGEGRKKSIGAIIFWIVLMNVVFSFDSILSAMALSDVWWVMTLAIVISGVMMIYLSDRVASFLEKNRMYEVLGLFVLLIVGIMLVSEGGHLAHLKFFGEYVKPMTKTTFYFVLGVLVLIDIVQGRYQKQLLARKASSHAG